MSPLRRALSMLPRFDNPDSSAWDVRGQFCMTNHQLLPPVMERALRKLMKRDEAWGFWRVVHMNVFEHRHRIWVLHRRLKWKSLQYLVRSWSWQRWRSRDGGKHHIPVFIKYCNKYIVWNGTHRTTLCILAAKPLRVKVIDLDLFIRRERRARRRK